MATCLLYTDTTDQVVNIFHTHIIPIREQQKCLCVWFHSKDFHIISKKITHSKRLAVCSDNEKTDCCEPSKPRIFAYDNPKIAIMKTHEMYLPMNALQIIQLARVGLS